MRHYVATGQEVPTWSADWQRWHGDRPEGRLAHWCDDWDGLPIDEQCMEFMCCTCTWESPELTQLASVASQQMREEYERIAPEATAVGEVKP